MEHTFIPEPDPKSGSGEARNQNSAPSDMVRSELEKILRTERFIRSENLSRLLRFIVEHALKGQSDSVKEYYIGTEVFGRGSSFDSKTDTIVRVQARNLRSRLHDYYEQEGRDDLIVIEIPKGAYVPVFHNCTDKLLGPTPAPPRKPYISWKIGAFLPVTVMAIAVLLYMRPGPVRRGPGTRKQLKVSPLTSLHGNVRDPAFSPDGRQVAFAWNAETDSGSDIYVRYIQGGAPLKLTTNPGIARNPAWSPDGREIAFTRKYNNQNGIFIISALGGQERKLSVTPSYSPFWQEGGTGLSWSADGTFLAFSDQASSREARSIFLLSLRDLQRRRLTKSPHTDSALGGDVLPTFSPDNRLAFLRRSTTTEIYVVSIHGGEPKRLTFDNADVNGLDWTAGGSDIVFASNRSGWNTLWRSPAAGGSPQPLPFPGNQVSSVAVSRRGSLLAYTDESSDTNIWRAEISGGSRAPTRLIASSRGDESPQISPDGARIVFVSDRSGNLELWQCNKNGEGALQLTAFGGAFLGSPRWSPDGKEIAFDVSHSKSGGDIYVINAEGGSPRRLTAETSTDVVPHWSEDGQWIYFGSDRSGDWQIWKVPAEGGTAVPLSRKGGFVTLGVGGGFIYYVKYDESGVWRMPADGGEEAIFLSGIPYRLCRYSAVFRDGIYFLNPTTRSVEFCEFATKRVKRVFAFEGVPLGCDAGLTISPDRQSLLYVRLDKEDGNIMLVENFE